MLNGETLRTLRLKAGLTVSALSGKAGLSEHTIEGIERGQRQRINDATLIALAKGLEMDVTELDRQLNASRIQTA